LFADTPSKLGFRHARGDAQSVQFPHDGINLRDLLAGCLILTAKPGIVHALLKATLVVTGV
jgi:hypothetical protein